MKIFLILLLATSSAHAVDFNKYIGLMKKQINSLLKGKEEKKASFEMPLIPALEETATSTEVYEKSGRIYTQGVSFQKLSDNLKRQYRMVFVKELYKVVKGVEALPREVIRGINVLEHGGTRPWVYRSLVLSSDYRNLEAYQEVPDDIVIKKALFYAKKFLGVIYQKDQLQKLNLWGIKRILVEKALEVMDAYPKDGELLYRWYAYLSVQLGSERSIKWNNQTRASTDLDFHYNWAQKVPIQHVKSEVIIKFHRFFNSMN